MINQLVNPYNYTAPENACINNAGNDWGSQSNCIKSLKLAMNIHFDTHQNERCCYCGLLYDRTGRGEIEHIAPKGATYFPQFSFASNNLAKACQLCNSSSMKHTYNPVNYLDAVYEQCTFTIVHPYLDDHGEHYNWSYGRREVIISINNNSDKARESIRIFELASEKRTRARATQRNQERLEDRYHLTAAIKNRIKAVLRFR
jgi:uncharacterized protein (TIGR02646 family)